MFDDKLTPAVATGKETVLDRILHRVSGDIARSKLKVSLDTLKQRANNLLPLDAYSALDLSRADTSVKIIAEVKRKSPSKGVLAPIEDPSALAAAYQRGGAAVISVLTERHYFGGSLGDFDAVRGAVGTPLLMKNFIIDPYQVWEARAHGADLVLLIVAALDDTTLLSLLNLTHSLGMNALVETHTQEEVRRAVQAGAKIIGVNTRNLKTLDVDPSVFEKVAPSVPSGIVIVAESGVTGIDDVRLYASQGAHAVLVGEALVRGGDPVSMLRKYTAVRRSRN